MYGNPGVTKCPPLLPGKSENIEAKHGQLVLTSRHLKTVDTLHSSQQITELSRFKDLPDEVPLPLVIGTKVTGMHFVE